MTSALRSPTSVTMNDSSSSATPSTALSPSPPPLYLTFDAPPVHTVEEAGQNHFERFTPPLSSLERFYVAVAQAFAQQEVDRRKADEATAAQRRGSKASPPLPLDSSSRSLPSSHPLLLQHLTRTATTLDHFLALIDNLLSHRQLSLALTHPSRDPKAADADDPSSPFFQLTRRNRLAVLLQSHASHLQATAQLLSKGAAALKRSLRLHHRFMGDLQRLSNHWLVRHKPTTATSVLPPLMVDLSMEGLVPSSAGRVMLRRDEDGRVAVDDTVGQCTASETLHLDSRQRRRRERQQRREDRQRLQPPDADDEWKQDEDNAAAAPPPTSIAASTSARGWMGTASRLHRTQRHLLHQQLHALLLKEAQGSPLSHLCTVSVVHHRITVESSAFPTLWIDWDDGPLGHFTVRSASRSLTAALNGDLLYLSLLAPLLSHSARYSSSNQPLALAALANSPVIPSPPPVLSHIITCAYHTHLVLSIRRLLEEMVLPHPSVTLWLPPPPELNVLTFSLHRDSVFLLQCTVVGVDISAISRRHVKAQAIGITRLGTAAVAEEWNADVVDGPLGHVGVDNIQCTSLQHLRQLIEFAANQPLQSPTSAA